MLACGFHRLQSILFFRVKWRERDLVYMQAIDLVSFASDHAHPVLEGLNRASL